MSETKFAKGASTTNVLKPLHYATRRHGGFEVGIVNTHADNDMVAQIEGANRTKGSLEVPDWRHAEAVGSQIAVAAGGVERVIIPKAEASHTHYRVKLGSAATGLPASYVVFTEDEVQPAVQA